MNVAIVDYGMGNLRSVTKACEQLGAVATVVDTPAAISGAERLIVPGVGAFGDAMHELNRLGLVEPIREFARSGRPMLGICLGLQVLFESSEEAPGVQGLCLLPGTVKRFCAQALKVPHMGWNRLEARPSSRLLRGIAPADAYVYFVHSYYVSPEDEAVIAATTESVSYTHLTLPTIYSV